MGVITNGNYAKKWINNCVIINLYFLLTPPYKLKYLEECERHEFFPELFVCVDLILLHFKFSYPINNCDNNNKCYTFCFHTL